MWYLIVSIPDLCILTYFEILEHLPYSFYVCVLATVPVSLPNGAMSWSVVLHFLVLLNCFITRGPSGTGLLT